MVTMLIVYAYSMAVKWRRTWAMSSPAPPSPADTTASISPVLSRGSASAKEMKTGRAPADLKTRTALASDVRTRKPLSASALSMGFFAHSPAAGHGERKSSR